VPYPDFRSKRVDWLDRINARVGRIVQVRQGWFWLGW